MSKDEEPKPDKTARVPMTDAYQPLRRGYQPQGSSEIPEAPKISSNVVIPAPANNTEKPAQAAPVASSEPDNS